MKRYSIEEVTAKVIGSLLSITIQKIWQTDSELGYERTIRLLYLTLEQIFLVLKGLAGE